MNRILIQSILALFAAAAVTGSLCARSVPQDPPKERPKVEKAVRVEQVKQAPKERAPAGEAPKPEAPGAAAPAPAANPREIAKKAAHFESVHRDRIARIDRLIEIYKEKGEREKVTELQALREAQLKRHTNAMENFRKQIGSEKFGKFEKELRGPGEHANANEKDREARKAANEGKQGAKPPHEKTDGKH